MRHFVSITLLLIGLKATCLGQDAALVKQFISENDTLTVGNEQISLFYTCKEDVMLIGYQRNNDKIVYFSSPKPDLRLMQDNVNLVLKEFKQEEKQRFPGEDSYTQVSLHYQLDDLEIKRIWEVYPNTPAIASYYYLKGVAENWFSVKSTTGATELIEDVSLLANTANMPTLANLPLQPDHWQAKVVSFYDATDHNNNLVTEQTLLPYVKPLSKQGNLLLLKNKITDTGIFILKESPLGNSQQAYPGFDFLIDNKNVALTGIGLEAQDIQLNNWQRTYGFVIGFSETDEIEQLTALRRYQKNIRKLRADRDEMILSNTWGDRSKDGRMNEKFILQELEAAAKLGITHFQLDDGWQEGLSKNSSQKAGEKWEEWETADWVPHKSRFPRGLDSIVKKAKSLNIELGLWFNPSSNNDYEPWLRDAEILMHYYNQYGIKVFKIDGVDIKNKKGEENLRKFFDHVMKNTDGNAVFNLDVTAGKRGGYHYFNEYGNIFLENRYTDWANYYPHYTLRNLWQLSKYVPAEKIQIEWLNTWRNIKKYPTQDPLAPVNSSWEYQMAIAFMGQPLAWMEVSNLPKEAFRSSKALKKYKSLQHDIHSGVILPIGDEPDGFSWTGFQSMKQGNGYFLIFREKSERTSANIKTWLPAGAKVKVKNILGSGTSFTATTDDLSQIQFDLPSEFNYALYSYEVVE